MNMKTATPVSFSVTVSGLDMDMFIENDNDAHLHRHAHGHGYGHGHGHGQLERILYQSVRISKIKFKLSLNRLWKINSYALVPYLNLKSVLIHSVTF
jgi:hypothetical protein